MKLTKLSSPGWEKEFETEAELKAELYSHICDMCRKGDIITKEEDPELKEDWVLWDAVDENSSLDDLLWTPCGCEFMTEE
jgi:hypothetical protein